MRVPGGLDSCVEFLLDVLTAIHKLDDLSQRVGVRRAQIGRVDVVCPPLEVRCSLLAVRVLRSLLPPSFQELLPGRHRVNHSGALVVGDYADLQWLGTRRCADEHRDCVVVSLEGSPVMSKSVKHELGDKTAMCQGLGVLSRSSHLRARRQMIRWLHRC